MNYNQWVEWLETRNPMPELRPGVEKTSAALKEAGLIDLIDPQKVIHIAGTNGKGTTAKTLEQLLSSAGCNVGLYTSPHLIDTTERIRSGDRNISQNTFCTLCESYKPLIEKWNLTHFEALTVFAVDYFFKQKKVDFAIFEIGLGGTWDATNVIPHNTSVITALGFDHTHILGKTLEEIADNKFGIIHRKNTVLHQSYSPSIQNLLEEKIKTTRSTEILVPPAEFTVQKNKPVAQYILKTKWGEALLALPGARAAQNTFLALHVFEHLGFSPQKHLPHLAKITWPARMTPFAVTSPCPVYLSGDHNSQGIESLIEILNQSDYNKLFIILGVSKNRSHVDFIEPLLKLKNRELVLTKPQFQGVTPNSSPIPYFDIPSEALEHMIRKATPSDLIVITGSLYLCGDYLKWSIRQS